MSQSDAVEQYITKSPFREGLSKIRKILLEEGLEEGLKWGAPIYMINGKNVIGLASMKNFASIWFHQGVFLKDKEGVLINAQEDKTKALRQWRFTNEAPDEELLRAYIREAVQNEKSGKRLKPTRKSRVIPPELNERLIQDGELKRAFEGLPQGKKNEYIDYITEAKRAETKQKRMEKIIPMIKSGMGLHDRYRKA